VHFVLGGCWAAADFKGADVSGSPSVGATDGRKKGRADRMASQRANWSASFRSWLVNAVLAFFFFDATDASFRLYFAALALLVAARICCVGSRDVGRMAVRGVVRLRAERQYLGVAIVNHCLFACLMRSFLARRKKVEFKRDFPRES